MHWCFSSLFLHSFIKVLASSTVYGCGNILRTLCAILLLLAYFAMLFVSELCSFLNSKSINYPSFFSFFFLEFVVLFIMNRRSKYFIIAPSPTAPPAPPAPKHHHVSSIIIVAYWHLITNPIAKTVKSLSISAKGSSDENPKSLDFTMAGACRNRTHPGRGHRPTHGFEDRGDHQAPCAPIYWYFTLVPAIGQGPVSKHFRPC